MCVNYFEHAKVTFYDGVPQAGWLSLMYSVCVLV